jgi:hypothetical protein
MTKDDLKWSYCWDCEINQAICPECNQAWCVTDCECNQPEWRNVRDEVYNNNERPELPSYEEMKGREDYFLQYQLFQLFPPTEKQSKFYDEMKEKFIAAYPHLRPKVYEEKMKEIFNKDFQGFHHKLK